MMSAYEQNKQAIHRQLENYLAQTEPQTDAPNPMVRQLIATATSRVSDTDYFHRRGLSDETISRYRLGYLPQFDTRGEDGYSQWQAVVIPTGEDSGTIRNTDELAASNQRIRKRGDAKLFHAQPWPPQAPVFVVEGEFDALSVAQLGHCAIALGGTTNVAQFAALCAQNPPKRPVIIALDDDQAGRTATEQLCERLGAVLSDDIVLIVQNCLTRL